MAKHMIYPHPHPNPDGTNADSRIELQWQRHPAGDVRLATTRWAGDGPPDTTRAYLDPLGPDAELRYAWDGRYVELDRDQLNHLIRQLRTARDQAYGRDE